MHGVKGPVRALQTTVVRPTQIMVAVPLLVARRDGTAWVPVPSG